MGKTAEPVGSLGEFGLINRLISAHTAALPPGVKGAGDDCAVIPLSRIGAGDSRFNFVVTTDLMVENRHFRLSYCKPYDIGWKLLAVNLSDIAAMGAEPLFAVITLQLRPDTEVSFTEELYAGIFALAERYGVSLVGGDTTSGSELSLGLTLFGRCEGDPVFRSGAAAGDSVWVSGDLGGANVALCDFEGISPMEITGPEAEMIVKRFMRPDPRIELGMFLRKEKLCSAMMDVSDGLFQDAGHIAQASGVDIEIDPALVPCSVPGRLISAVSGGEDYELLFTASPEQEEKLAGLSADACRAGAMPRVTRIGRVFQAEGQFPLVRVKTGGQCFLSVSEFMKKAGASEGPGFTHF